MGNAQPTYDSLEYASELKDAGFTEEQSKIQAKALFRIIDQQLVTKRDIKELETKLTYDMKELEVKLSHDIQNAKNDIILKLGGLIVALFAISGTLITILKVLGKS